MTAQDLMPFEAVVVAVEIAEQNAKLEAIAAAMKLHRERVAAAKLARHQKSLERKAAKQQKADDWRRRTAHAREYKTPDEHAQCGIRWYSRSPKERDTGVYWKNCHKCGQPLIYTSDRNAKPQDCKADQI